MDTRSPCRSDHGFTLVEILIAMAIALIGTVMMFRVIENFEVRKRSTAAGGDAQISGATALYNLERDIGLAGNGFGMLPPTQMGCIASVSDSLRSTPAIANFRIAPVEITDGASGTPDTITVLYGQGQTDFAGQLFSASTITTKQVDPRNSHAGFVSGDLVLVFGTTNCGIIEITGHGSSVLQHAATSYPAYYPGKEVAQVHDSDYEYEYGDTPLNQVRNITPRYNTAAGYNPATSGTLYNLGQRSSARRNTWSIQSGRILNVIDDMHDADAPGPGQDIAEGVINMQAEYGLDTDTVRDYVVNTWQSTAPSDWTRVIAVRVALLARSQQYEKTALPMYATCATTIAGDAASCQRPRWAGGGFAMTDLDATTDTAPNSVNDWRRYRYRVYQATIPLRNVIWGTAP